jgi:hypothetical protein
MRKIILILLFTVFCSSFSLAGSSEKITIKEVYNTYTGVYFEELRKIGPDRNSRAEIKTLAEQRLETSIKRQKKRGNAKCLYEAKRGSHLEERKCGAKVIRYLLKKSEINKKRKPGDLFYVLDAAMVFTKRYYPTHLIYKPNSRTSSNSFRGGRTFKKSFDKALNKFKNNPSNEKVFHPEIVEYIKYYKLLKKINEKIGDSNWTELWLGTGSSYVAWTELGKLAQAKGYTGTNQSNLIISNYSLLGDLLNESVANVKKNNVSPELKQRRILLKKYSLILQNIENKLEIDKFKSIDKDISKLSKTYETLKVLEKNPNEIITNIDKAVNIILDTNKLILKSSLNAKDDEGEKLLSLASINFMQFLIDSILSTIPEKYTVETKELRKDLFNEYDLETIEAFIKTMAVKNKTSKIAELKKNTDTINKYINTSDVIKKLSDIGIKSIFDKEITINSAVKTAELQIRDIANQEMFKNVKSILQDLDQNDLNNINEELSEVASEVASDPSFQEATSDSVLDKDFGGMVTVKHLIGAARNR